MCLLSLYQQWTIGPIDGEIVLLYGEMLHPIHVKIKRRLTEYFLNLTMKLVLNDALTEFHEENFMRLRHFQEFVEMR